MRLRTILLNGACARVSLFETEFCQRRSCFDVAVELGGSTQFPVPGVVFVRVRTMAQRAEEGAVLRAEHDADVPTPDDQVTRLRMLDLTELIDSTIQVRGIRVRIRKSRPLINGVNEVRAVGALAEEMRITRDGNNP